MFHFSPRNALLPSTALAILLGLTACGGGGGSDDTTASASASASAAAAAAAAGTASGAAAGAAAGTITTTTPPPALPTKALGLTDQRASPVATPNVVRLVGFDIATPNTLTTNVAIATAAGVGAAAFAANEWIFGMDYRPADGLLWGLTNRGRLYTIDPTTGVATFKVALVADPAAAGFTGLDASTSVSVDFNPVVDRMRVVTFTGQNLRINVATGATIEDTAVPQVATTGFSFVAGAAYTNSFAGATATTLFTINNSRDDLATQTPPNSGTQVPVGPLGVAISEVQGMDIAGSTNQLVLGALSLNGAAGPHSLYNISLTTGAAVLRPATTGTAEIGGAAGLPLVDIAIRP